MTATSAMRIDLRLRLRLRTAPAAITPEVTYRESVVRTGALALLAALLVVGACTATLSRDPFLFDDEPVAMAQFPDQELLGDEEVLAEEDEFGRTPQGPTAKAGEILTAVTYVGMIVAGILLPLLAI
jgi:hypothetical protein